MREDVGQPGLRIEPFIFAVMPRSELCRKAPSTPACSSSIAALCLSTCGETRLDFNDGHVSLAARTCLASNYWMLSSLNRPACTLGLNAVAPFRAVPEPCLESTPNMCGQRRASIFPPLADTSDVKPRRRDGWHPC